MIALLALAQADVEEPGYGVPVNGYPSAAERWLVLWTNAARVAPEEFTEDYAAGGCSPDDFSDDERTPKPPLYVDLALTEAARYHSNDMETNGCFQHESCDGTDTWTRIGRYYDEGAGGLGENIAMGSADGRFAVLTMWMCSHDGHRANIMAGNYNEMGGGISGVYQTQDFAGGELTEGAPPVRMAAEGQGEWFADWGDEAAPAVLEVVRDGIPTPMALRHGTAEQGVYAMGDLPELDQPCHFTYVYWETAAGVSGHFPAMGSFADGECGEEVDAVTAWAPQEPLRGGLFYEVPEDDLEDAMKADVSLTGCSSAPYGAGAWLLGLVLVLRRRR